MTNKELGDWGESKAKNYLNKLGYTHIASNWRYKKAEIDLIYKKDQILIFVEVKTRSSDYLGAPEIGITLQKEQLLIDAAGAYMDMVNHEWEIRFDVVAILFRDKNNFKLTHFKDAFYPEIE